MEFSLPVNNAISGSLIVSNKPEFSDISDDELVMASACADYLTTLDSKLAKMKTSHQSLLRIYLTLKLCVAVS